MGTTVDYNLGNADQFANICTDRMFVKYRSVGEPIARVWQHLSYMGITKYQQMLLVEF